MFISSTETSSTTDEHLFDYARRCLAAEWEANLPQKTVWSLEDSWRNYRRREPNITIDEVRARHEQLGYVFYETAAEAEAAADDLVNRCCRAIEAVYGKDALVASATMPD